MGLLLACFGCGRGGGKGGRQHSARSHRRKSRRHSKGHANGSLPPATSLRVSTISPGGSPRTLSTMSEDEFFDAHEEPHTPESLGRLSGDGYHSAGESSTDSDSPPAPTLLDRLKIWWADPEKPVAPQGAEGNRSRGPSPPLLGQPPPSGAGGATQAAADESEVIVPESPSKALVGCISIFTATQVAIAHKRFLRTSKPAAGASIKRRTEEDEAATACLSWENADPRSFMVRSLHYMKSKQKEACAGAFYSPVGVDFYSFDFKINHIAKHIQLPAAPALGPGALALPPNERLPPLLIINIQLPTYTPSLFSTSDGPGHSLVFYFALPEGWEPSQVDNHAALAMVQRLVHNGVEFDGQPTRDRLKLIGRVVNVEEWSEKGPLSGYEHRLLLNYNDKPLLTRPQHRFYSGPGYLEVDIDIHAYAYLARKALHLFIGRLATVIFENAFVLQGNRPEELPEVLLGCARVFRVDFNRAYPFPAQSLDSDAAAASAAGGARQSVDGNASSG